MCAVLVRTSWNKPKDSIKSRRVASACLRPDRFASARTGRLNCSVTTTRHDEYPAVDADGGTQGSHILWNVAEYALP